MRRLEGPSSLEQWPKSNNPRRSADFVFYYQSLNGDYMPKFTTLENDRSR